MAEATKNRTKSPNGKAAVRSGPVADRVRDEPSGGHLSKHIHAVANPELAAPRSWHGMTIPLLPDGMEYLMQLDVWLDPEARVTRLAAALPSREPDEVVKQWTAGSIDLRLSNFRRESAPPLPAET